MRTTQDYDVARTYSESPAAPAGDEPEGMGWIVFATVMLGLAALWNVFAGIAAIADAHVYVANANYVFSDLSTWGWIVMLLGIAQGIAALALMSGSELARWFGIAVAGINSIAQLMFIPAFPFWGIAMFAVDMLIIYGLAVYGGARLRRT
ncbi:MAG TPA: hypothetical protein VLD13_10600 [Gaiellaceae bacterium]|nr:hypothetical protein [Gaiellaceae bacterium]